MDGEGRVVGPRSRARELGFGAVVVGFVGFALFPFYYAILSSLRSGSQLFRPELLPRDVTFQNYAGILADGAFVDSVLNSVLVASATVAVSLVIALGASYALARFEFRGRGLLLFSILGVSMFPQVAVLSGMFELVRGLGLYNTKASLVLADLILTLPFTVWVLNAFMRDLPKELEEAAMIDGAPPWMIVTQVFLPLLWPALVTTGLLAFIAAWNEFLFALTFTLTPDQRTVPVAIALMSGGSQHELPFGNIMAASVLVTLPLLVLVIVFQKKIVAGLTAGAVKG